MGIHYFIINDSVMVLIFCNTDFFCYCMIVIAIFYFDNNNVIKMRVDIVVSVTITFFCLNQNISVQR